MEKIIGIQTTGFSAGVFFKNAISDSTTTSIKVKLPDDRKVGKVSSWGDDNNYPAVFLDALRKNGAASGGLKILKSVHFGEGFTLYKENIDENGKRQKILVNISDYPEIKKFFRVNKFQNFYVKVISDLETFSIAFVEYVVSNDYKKIVRVKRHKAAWCRFEEMDEKERRIKNVYIRWDWSESEIDDGYTEKVPMFDEEMTIDEILEIIKKKKIKKFIIPVMYPTADEAVYPKTDWHASYKNGWMDVSNAVPKLKKAIFENQLHIKYIIYISDEYFQRYYQDEWDDFTTDKKDEIRKNLLREINDHLSGNKAGGRSISAPKFKTADGDWVKGIEIETIDNKLKDGAHLPDASAANSEILFAMGVDPSLIGAGVPGGKLGAGSGSDKREAYTILASLFKFKRQVSLQIWNFIQEWNGWDSDLIGAFPNTVLTTLDKNPTGKETKI